VIYLCKLNIYKAFLGKQIEFWDCSYSLQIEEVNNC
jgi:hypothetical protein